MTPTPNHQDTRADPANISPTMPHYPAVPMPYCNPIAEENFYRDRQQAEIEQLEVCDELTLDYVQRQEKEEEKVR